MVTNNSPQSAQNNVGPVCCYKNNVDPATTIILMHQAPAIIIGTAPAIIIGTTNTAWNEAAAHTNYHFY